MQRSRCTMMFGFAPVTGCGAPVDAEMASSAGSVDSGEASLDAWAEQNLDYPCRLSLGQVEKCRRQQILWMVKEKCERNVVQGNPSAYTQGVIAVRSMELRMGERRQTPTIPVGSRNPQRGSRLQLAQHAPALSPVALPLSLQPCMR